jgi:tRNA A-37 threonylcarbamoyl transferase component Bud32
MDTREVPLPSRYRLLEAGRIEGPVETLDVLDTELDRMVVLCRWRGEPRAFRTWSRARAQLEVAGIPPVYDVGTLPDGARYLTVQAVHGRTVEEAQLDDGGFVRVWAEACRIVAWAHGRGIVHGDLVPLRMRVDARGRVQIGGWLGSASRPSVDLESLRRLFRARFPDAPDLQASSAAGLAEAGEAWFRRQTA